MINKVPTLTAACDVCGEEIRIPLQSRGDGLWYDGRVDSDLDTLGWYVVGDTSICDICHGSRFENVA